MGTKAKEQSNQQVFKVEDNKIDQLSDKHPTIPKHTKNADVDTEDIKSVYL